MTLPFMSSAPELYLPYDGASFNNLDLKTLSTPRIAANEKTAVIVTAGQSTAANNVDTAYVAANASKIANFNHCNGGTYVAAEPLLGCTGPSSLGPGNLFYRLADQLITAGLYQRVILAPIAWDATWIALWGTGGILQTRIANAVRRLAAVGLAPTMFLWQQGEQDNFLGTTQAAYAASLAQVIAQPRAIGANAPWLIGKTTYINGTVSAAVQAAQAGIVNGTSIFAGANTDSLTGTTVNRQGDNTHFKAAGADAAAALWLTAIDAVF